MKSSMCENCVKYKTIYCPNSGECFAREDKPFYEDKYTILAKNEALEEVLKDYAKENQQLKLINKEYERLNKENGRGFTIISAKQYNIDELLKYKNNWNELKQYIMKNDCHNDRHKVLFTYSELIVRMNELERGVSDAED